MPDTARVLKSRIVNQGKAASHRLSAQLDLARDPVIVFCEITRACALACRHCRAEAQPKRHPMELDTAECSRVLDQVIKFDQPPIVVLSGGDPFMRRDLFEIVEYGVSLGLTIAVAPSATALVTDARLRRLAALGVSSVSFSLDAATAEAHDAFRGFRGTFDRTLRIMQMAREAGLAFQVNTTVTRQTLRDLPGTARLIADSGARVWDLFFLVPTGRAHAEDLISPHEHEEVFGWVMENAAEWPFRVKTTLGQHYRRAFIMRQLQANPLDPVPEDVRLALAEAWSAPPTNDGRGVAFISHLGDVYPSGFLPLRVGNVRRDSIVDLYRDAPLFRLLRDSSALKGKCGVCPFNEVCGGSRARAYAMTGDAMASDPSCAYQPAATTTTALA